MEAYYLANYDSHPTRGDMINVPEGLSTDQIATYVRGVMFEDAYCGDTPHEIWVVTPQQHQLIARNPIIYARAQQ